MFQTFLKILAVSAMFEESLLLKSNYGEHNTRNTTLCGTIPLCIANLLSLQASLSPSNDSFDRSLFTQPPRASCSYTHPCGTSALGHAYDVPLRGNVFHETRLCRYGDLYPHLTTWDGPATSRTAHCQQILSTANSSSDTISYTSKRRR